MQAYHRPVNSSNRKMSILSNVAPSVLIRHPLPPQVDTIRVNPRHLNLSRWARPGTWVPSTEAGQVDPQSNTVGTTDNRRDLIKSGEATLPEFEPLTMLSRDHISSTPLIGC